MQPSQKTKILLTKRSKLIKHAKFSNNLLQPLKLLISALLLIFDFLAKIDYNQTNIGKVSMWGNFSGECRTRIQDPTMTLLLRMQRLLWSYIIDVKEDVFCC